MVRTKKGELERIADLILMDDAVEKGYVKGTGNKHGFGRYMREKGMINPAWQSSINAHEKTGFDNDQLEELGRNGADRRTRERYREIK